MCPHRARQDHGTQLATGWREPNDIIGQPSVCTEPGLLFSVELQSWPRSDGLQGLAFRFGSWIEDAFGSVHRRLLAHSGEFEGRFDGGRYGW